MGRRRGNISIKLAAVVGALLVSAPIQTEAARAIVPIIAYNPTYRLIVGGAFFRFPSDGGQGSHMGIQFLSTFTNNVKIVPEYKLLWGMLRFELNGKWSTFFDPYYGEGAETNVLDYVELDEESGRIEAGLYLQTGIVRFGPIYDYRYRQNRGVDGNPAVGLIAPESTGASGGRLIIDWRDTVFSSKKGGYLGATYLNVPRHASTSDRAFSLYTAEVRQFLTLEPFTLALRMAGGQAEESTSYLFRFRMGGTDDLRGYHANRFRGTNYYLGQAELRLEIIKALSLVAFTDAGQIGDPVTRGIKQTYGGGLRFGLPPDWLKKARLDIAFAKDESGVSFVFDETF